MNQSSLFANVTNENLVAEVKRLAACEREATAKLIASLMELDARRLYLQAGYSSLFTFCTRLLHLSEHAAYGRIEAARAARRFPVILDMLEQGQLTLTAVGLLAPHLTPVNHAELLHKARHQTKRDIEQLVARIRPQPDVPTIVRKLPEKHLPHAVAPPYATEVADDAQKQITQPPPSVTRPAVVQPLAPERYKLQVTMSRETYDKLRRAQDLLRHTIPSGDPAAIVDKALTLLVGELERRKVASTDRPKVSLEAASRSRRIPAAIRRAVWQRDSARCAFVGTTGRCGETGFLEFHHVVPYAVGGETTVANLELRCRAHNQHEAHKYFSRPQPPPIVREVGYLWAVSTTRSGPELTVRCREDLLL
jgi:5-methylcytosine-specific restriction endonuclease McrA